MAKPPLLQPNGLKGARGCRSVCQVATVHSQLQEGLRYDLMREPAVSGAQTYKELCLAAKNEEKRLAELKKRQRYQKPLQYPSPIVQVLALISAL